MTTVTGEQPPQHDYADVVGLIIGAALSNEIKCLALGAMGSTPLPVSTLYQKIWPYDVEPKHPEQFRRFRPHRLGSVAAHIGYPFVSSHKTTAGERLLSRTKFGEFASAMGGHLLQLSCESSVPIRLLVGEPKVQRDADGNIISNSTSTRIGVLAEFLLEAQTWQPTARLLPHIADRLDSSEKTILPHMERLLETKLVEKRKIKLPGQRNKIAQYRLKPADEFRDPAGVIKKYLEIVVRFANGDLDVVEEGYECTRRILGNKSYVPYLIQRSLAASGHTGKSVGIKS